MCSGVCYGIDDLKVSFRLFVVSVYQNSSPQLFEREEHNSGNCIYLPTPLNRLIGLVGRMFANGPGGLGSIPGRVIPKTFKMVLDTSLLNTQQYKVRIEGKVEQSRERSSALPYTSV